MTKSEGAISERSNGKQKEGKNEKKKRRQYFQHELEKLREELEKCSEEIQKKKPEEKEFSPNIFNDLKPYSSTSEAEFFSKKQHKTPYKARMTSISLCDPEVSHEYDLDDEERQRREKERRKRQGLIEEDPQETSRSTSRRKNDKKKKDKKRGTQKGSTHLPKHPDSLKEDEKYWKRELTFVDVPWLRRELYEQYTTNSQNRIDFDYRRTKEDFYRMELDRLDEVAESSRDNLIFTYRAYLENTPGSKKALIECIKKTEKELQDAENKENEDEASDKKSDCGSGHEKSESGEED